jgi:DNA-binding response OmpR family regulator
MPDVRKTIAVFNHHQDTVDMLRGALEAHGFHAIGVSLTEVRLHQVDLARLIERNDPKVIVYDVNPPYDISMKDLEGLRTAPPVQGRPFILTSTNPNRVKEIIGHDAEVHAIFGKPYDLERVMASVNAALDRSH